MTKTDKKRVLIIDSLNLYLRAYIMDPSQDPSKTRQRLKPRRDRICMGWAKWFSKEKGT
jgi:hypothetical protein